MDSLQRNAHRYLLVALLSVIGVGTAFYHLVEKFSWVDAYYFSVTTLSTVGYGDIVPETTAGKIFTTFYIVVGIGIFSTFISLEFRRRADKIKKRRKG